MKPFRLTAAVLATALTLAAGAASAANVTPQQANGNLLFGSGNANGGFTVETLDNLEIGLRAKLRYDTNGQPQNTFP